MRPQELWGYFLLTYVALLLNTSTYVLQITSDGVWTSLFAAAVFVTYTSVYLLPVIIFTRCADHWDRLQWFSHHGRPSSAKRRRVVYAVAILSAALVQYIIFADKTVFGIFGFHLNGFVWNLVLTKGGVESMGGGDSTTIAAMLVGVLFVLIQSVLLFLVMRVGRVQRPLAKFTTRRTLIAGLVAAVTLSITQQVAYGVAHFRSYGPVLMAAEAFPGFVPTTFGHLAQSLGYKRTRETSFHFDNATTGLHYPHQEIQLDTSVEPPNIIWLAVESLRADMLQPDIMPNLWALSERAARFERHYSGGNGTRMGVFSMFYGLYGPYWFSFLAENRGPVLIDTLKELNFEMQMFTSSRFTYPEFEKTVFARIEAERLHEVTEKMPWRQDHMHITSMLDFIEGRDVSRPFMTYMFFESTHAKYWFPETSVIRRPYATDLNYVTMNIERDIDLMKNRYINSAHHVDQQIGRILEYLESHNLMDSTVLLVTGDHGEEFMEKGRWGHNSELNEEQTHVPLVLWVPGKSARVVTTITSHLDLPATIMPLLGVLNAPEDYSQGHDLFGVEQRSYTVLSDWNHVAYADENFKAVFPTSGFAAFRQSVTTADDVPVADRTQFYEQHQAQIIEVMHGLKKFRKQR